MSGDFWPLDYRPSHREIAEAVWEQWDDNVPKPPLTPEQEAQVLYLLERVAKIMRGDCVLASRRDRG